MLSVCYPCIMLLFFTYCSVVWDSISESLEIKLQKLQNRATQVITIAFYLKSSLLILGK